MGPEQHSVIPNPSNVNLYPLKICLLVKKDTRDYLNDELQCIKWPFQIKKCDFVRLVRFRSRKDAMENLTELLKIWLAKKYSLFLLAIVLSAELLKVAHNLGKLLFLYYLS